MALTTQERERVRYHLGYPNVEAVGSLTFGIPKPIQTLYLVESSMDNILAAGEARVRKILCKLDDIEDRLFDAIDTTEAQSIGELRLRSGKAGETTGDLQEREYVRWASRLADQLGVPIYPFSERFAKMRDSINIPVG